jgi:translocation and assembly module TamB
VTVKFNEPLHIERSGMRFDVMTLKNSAELPYLVYPDPDTGKWGMYGRVTLPEGRIDVVGKYFSIEPDRARVTFVGNPGNPELNVTARWDAPDGTRVFAEVTGPLKAPKLQLRSEPARPQNEVLAQILFGTSDLASTGPGASRPAEGAEASAAAGVGGGVAAAGINRLIRDVTPINISTRIDTTQSQNVRPSVVVEVAKNVLAEATVNTGVVPIGQNPDRYLLTLDWRFLSAWSLRTTVGDAGSSILDLLWQHRY